MSEDWAVLSDHEKANIKRTIAEIAFLVGVTILANFAFGMKTKVPDDDEERFWALLAYQTYRLRAELLFFTPVLNNAMSILRSPAATMSVVENLIRLTSQMWNPDAVYQRGPWKGQLKLKKDAIMLIPLYKQYFRWRDISDQISFFRQNSAASYNK